jgi:hypothetical protein
MPLEFPLWSVEERTAWVEANSGPTGTPRDAAYDRWNDLSDEMEIVTEELGTTAPTTMAGVATLLAYWSEIMGDDGDDQRQDFYDTQEFLERFAEAIGDREAQS